MIYKLTLYNFVRQVDMHPAEQLPRHIIAISVVSILMPFGRLFDPPNQFEIINKYRVLSSHLRLGLLNISLYSYSIYTEIQEEKFYSEVWTFKEDWSLNHFVTESFAL